MGLGSRGIKVPYRGFLKKILERQNGTVCTSNTQNDANMLQEQALGCHSDKMLPHTDQKK